MTSEDFIAKICKLYKVSRTLSISAETYNIWRGVNHSISSQSEDLLALFIATNLEDNTLEFIVDKTMTCKIPHQKSIQFRPDLAIVKNGVLTHSIDLKMDMGYKRRYFETPEFRSEALKFNILRSQNFESVSYRKNNKRVELKVSSKLTNQIVVISEKNAGKPSNRLDMIKAIDNMNWVNIYYLTGGVHPNNYDDEFPIINDNQFIKLIDDVKNLLN